MNHITQLIGKAALSFGVLSMILVAGTAFPTKAYAYTDQEIADGIIWAIGNGMSMADIGAALSVYGVTEGMLSQVATRLGYTDAVTTAGIQQMYAQVITVVEPPPTAPTPQQVTEILSSPTATPQEMAVQLAAGGISANDLITTYHINDPATVAAINQAYVGTTVIQGTTYYTSASASGPTSIYGTKSDGTIGVVATFNASTGAVALPSGVEVNIADAKGVSLSATAVGGSGVTTVMDGHSYAYQAGMISAGWTYLGAYNIANDPNATAVQKEAAVTAMYEATRAANAVVATESGGTQTQITVIANANGTLSYGCINSQNTTAFCPAGKSMISGGRCVANTVTTTSGTSGTTGTSATPVDTTTAAVTSVAPSSSGACDTGLLWVSPTSCVACANGLDGRTGCDGRGGSSSPGDAFGALHCMNGARNPIACDSFVAASGANAPTVTLSATPSTINTEQSAKLTWISANTNTCSATNEFGVGYTGTATENSAGVSVTPTVTSTYQITCLSSEGISTFSNAIVTVLNPSASISASRPLVSRDSPSTTISWTLTDVSGCTITKKVGTKTIPWQSSLSSADSTKSASDTPTTQTTYTLACPNLPPQSVRVNFVPDFRLF